MRRKSFTLVLSVLAVVFFLWGNQAMAADKVLKVGVQGPFTGPSAETGKQFRSAVTMAMEKIGYKVGDYKLELVWIDCQSDPAKATSAYAQAVEKDGVQAGMLNWHSSVAVALMDVVAQYKVPHIFGFGATEVVNEKYKSDPVKYSYWACKGWPMPASLMNGYVESINGAVSKGLFKPQKKLVAIYGEDTDWGRSAGGALKKDFTASGWQILSEDYFPITQTDFYPLLDKYKKAGVEVIAGTSATLPVMSAFIKQSQEVGLKAVIVADGLGWVGDWYKSTGPASNCVLDMIPQLASPKAKEWAKEFETKFNSKPSPSSAGLAYDGTNLFVKMLKRTLEKHHKLDSESIHEVITSEVATGKFSFSEKDGAIIMKDYKYTAENYPDPVVGPNDYFFPVIQYKEGKGDIIYPPAFAERNFETPK